MQLGSEGAMKTRDATRKLANLSKAWEVGDKAHVFYRMFKKPDGKWDILCGGIWGHSVSDSKQFPIGGSFIPSLTEIDENGIPIGVPDITYQFSQVCPAFIAGRKNLESSKLLLKKWPNDSMRSQALTTLEKQYDRNSMAKDAVKVAIGRLEYMVVTECTCVVLADNGLPNLQKHPIRNYAKKLNKKSAGILRNLANDKRYAPTDDFPYLEVEYNFIDANGDKAQAAQVDPAGLTAEYRLIAQMEAVEGDYSVETSTLLSNLSDLPEESEDIARHSYAFIKIPPTKIKATISTYVVMNTEHLAGLSATDDEMAHLLRQPELLRTAGILEQAKGDIAESPATIEMARAVEEYIAKQGGVTAAAIKDKVAEEALAIASEEAPTMHAPSMDDIMAGVINTNEDDDFPSNFNDETEVL